MQHQDINDYVKEKFIFVYDRRLLRHLRANNHRYLVEAINPRCMKTYWMFERTSNLEVDIDFFFNKFCQEAPLLKWWVVH